MFEIIDSTGRIIGLADPAELEISPPSRDGNHYVRLPVRKPVPVLPEWNADADVSSMSCADFKWKEIKLRRMKKGWAAPRELPSIWYLMATNLPSDVWQGQGFINLTEAFND